MGIRKDVLARYEDELFGIPVVVLNAAVRLTDEAERSFVMIPDEEGLAAAVAMARALLPVKLSGAELRMLRKTLGMKAKDFAEALNMDPARLSRPEHDAQGLGVFTEVNIRQFVCARLSRRVPAIGYDPAEIATMRIVEGPLGPLTFERVRLKHAHSQAKSDEWDLAA